MFSNVFLLNDRDITYQDIFQTTAMDEMEMLIRIFYCVIGNNCFNFVFFSIAVIENDMEIWTSKPPLKLVFYVHYVIHKKSK